MNENEFSTQVKDALKLFGWHFSHFRPALTAHGWRTAITGNKGFPDYVATNGFKVLFIEVKGDGGKLSPEQQEWQELLRRTGHEVFCWWPKDSDLMIEILGGRNA